jgi:hypothetical protein
VIAARAAADADRIFWRRLDRRRARRLRLAVLIAHFALNTLMRLAAADFARDLFSGIDIVSLLLSLQALRLLDKARFPFSFYFF